MLKVRIACLSLLIMSASSAYAADIIEMTQYHGDELKASSGKMWLGLFPTKSEEYELKATKVSITRVSDAIFDEPPEKKTAKKVSISHMGEPIALISGVPGLKPGRVSACSITKKEHLGLADKLKLNVGSNDTLLRVAGAKKGKEYFGNYEIILESGGKKQKLFQNPQISIADAPSLLWAGDLDRDGKVDLIMDTTDHYNVRLITLFLSSKATAGQLVKKVASHYSTGC